MTVNVGGKEKRRGEQQVTEKKEEEKFNPSDYSCEIIQEKTTIDKAKDRNLPTDAFTVTYMCEGTECMDVTRSGKMVNIFDMYYDRYGKDSLQKIDYGYGTVNPSQWGYKSTTKKKRRK